MGFFHQLNSKNWGFFWDKKDDFSSKKWDANIPIYGCFWGCSSPEWMVKQMRAPGGPGGPPVESPSQLK